MQTTKTRAARRSSPNPVKNPNGALGIRLGFKGCLASVESILSLPGMASDALLPKRVLALAGAVKEDLRTAGQLAISHPTLPTLRDAFDAVDSVLAACQSLRRRVNKVGNARIQARMELFLLGVRTGVAQLESGLETIELLPASAPDYPESGELARGCRLRQRLSELL